MGVRRKSGVSWRRVLELRAADQRVVSAELREGMGEGKLPVPLVWAEEVQRMVGQPRSVALDIFGENSRIKLIERLLSRWQLQLHRDKKQEPFGLDCPVKENDRTQDVLYL